MYVTFFIIQIILIYLRIYFASGSLNVSFFAVFILSILIEPDYCCGICSTTPSVVRAVRSFEW